jgi:hypothetical protein
MLKEAQSYQISAADVSTPQRLDSSIPLCAPREARPAAPPPGNFRHRAPVLLGPVGGRLWFPSGKGRKARRGGVRRRDYAFDIPVSTARAMINIAELAVSIDRINSPWNYRRRFPRIH